MTDRSVFDDEPLTGEELSELTRKLERLIKEYEEIKKFWENERAFNQTLREEVEQMREGGSND